MKKSKKNSKKQNQPTSRTSLPERISKYRQQILIAASCLTLALVIVVAVGANAKETLMRDPDVKKVAGKVQAQIREFKADNAPKGTSRPLAVETMPAQSKAVKARKEADQLIAQLTNSNSAITYDPWGRIAKIVEPDSSIRQFVYSGDRLCEERDGSGAVTKRFFDWGEMIGATKYFYTRDHLGSVTEMTDQSGNIVAQYKYDPWGNVTRIGGSGPDSDFLYAGYFYHKPSGLYITAHRLYSPKLGRWLNRDPIDDPTFAMMPPNPEPGSPSTLGMASAFAQSGAPLNPNMQVLQSASRDPIVQAQLMKIMPHGIAAPGPDVNPYAYVSNNPIGATDPSGLQPAGFNPWKWWKKWCWCRETCRTTQDWAYNQCIRSGKPPVLCKVIADGAYHACVAGCMANPDEHPEGP